MSFSTKNMTSFNQLNITGSTGNDSIFVTQSGGTLTVTANGQTTQYANAYGNLVIHGGAGGFHHRRSFRDRGDVALRR